MWIFFRACWCHRFMNWFPVELVLHAWDKSWLWCIILFTFFGFYLLILSYGFWICVHVRYWSVVFFYWNVFVWLGIRVKVIFIEWVGKYSLCFCLRRRFWGIGRIPLISVRLNSSVNPVDPLFIFPHSFFLSFLRLYNLHWPICRFDDSFANSDMLFTSGEHLCPCTLPVRNFDLVFYIFFFFSIDTLYLVRHCFHSLVILGFWML